MIVPTLTGQILGIKHTAPTRQQHASGWCAPPVPERLPGALVEAPADVELHRRHQHPLDELIHREAEDLGQQQRAHGWHHGEHHAEEEDGERQAGGRVEQPAQLLQLRLLARR